MLNSLRRRLSAPLRALQYLAYPRVPGRQDANRRAWERLPEALRRPDQIFGRQQPGCGATYHVMERCDFSCTACYLSNAANSVPPLSFEEVKVQLDAIREFLGPWGNTQITAGEVTLLPVEDLIRILRYCREIQLSAMVMTHGETFRDDPTYLERLVKEGGLEKIAIHVDTTQRGRRGMPKGAREQDLDFIRDEFAELIRATRRKTGRPLAAAHTFTVTEENLDQIPGVMDWVLDNADAFRMISFQPTAAVGRTRAETLTKAASNRQRLWDHVSSVTNSSLNPQPFIFGHPDCNDTSLAFVVRFGAERHVVEVVRKDEGVDRAFFDRLFGGSFAGFSPDGMSLGEAAAQILGRTLRQPRYAYEVPGYCLYRAFTERAWFPRFLTHVLRRREWSVHPLATVVHHFMSADELETPAGRERLEACVFRLPVNGQMISMCELNGSGLREELNLETTRRKKAASLPLAAQPS